MLIVLQRRRWYVSPRRVSKHARVKTAWWSVPITWKNANKSALVVGCAHWHATTILNVSRIARMPRAGMVNNLNNLRYLHEMSLPDAMKKHVKKPALGIARKLFFSVTILSYVIWPVRMVAKWNVVKRSVLTIITVVEVALVAIYVTAKFAIPRLPRPQILQIIWCIILYLLFPFRFLCFL